MKLFVFYIMITCGVVISIQLIITYKTAMVTIKKIKGKIYE